jgi:hypothetical protein
MVWICEEYGAYSHIAPPWTYQYMVSDVVYINVERTATHCHTLRALYRAHCHTLPHTAAHIRAQCRTQPRTLSHTARQPHTATRTATHDQTHSRTPPRALCRHFYAHCRTLPLALSHIATLPDSCTINMNSYKFKWNYFDSYKFIHYHILLHVNSHTTIWIHT